MIAICATEIKGSMSRVQTEARFQYDEAMVALGEAKGSMSRLLRMLRHYRSHPA